MFLYKRVLFVFLILAFFPKSADCAIYECIYKNKNGSIVTSSFNPIYKNKENYSELSLALRSGSCRELYVKKYFIDATSCNIQFYKSDMKIANITCQNNKQEPLRKLKAIARKDFGYMGL